mmetsp:Transcript_36228/g.87235  ORF Transcript_36228/g.87235 Transcript_36228/m.87235 type:complete len:2423 (-) Transcript_36228:173-7441(-)
MSFTFGAAPAPASAAPAAAGGGGGFSFGASNGPATAPAAAASTGGGGGGGLSFGTSGGSGPAPAPAGPAPAAPSTGTAHAPAAPFIFGSTTNQPAPGTAAPSPAPAAPNSGLFSSNTTTNTNSSNPNSFTAATGAPGNSTGTRDRPTVVVPAFDDIFTRLQVWEEVKRLCGRFGPSSSSSALADGSVESIDLIGQELRSLLGDHAPTTLKPQILSAVAPDQALRSNLQQRPVVGLDGDATKTRNLTSKNLSEMMSLATDLQISEVDAMTLYIQVASQLPVFRKLLSKNRGGAAGSSLLNEAVPSQMLQRYSIEGLVAREVYFLERHLQLQSLLFLVEMRLTKDPFILSATDFLLSNPQCNLIPNLTQLVQSYSQRIRELQTSVQNREVASQHSTWQSGFSATSPEASHDFTKVHLLFCQRQRQTAAEILFYIAYDTQLSVEELVDLIDVIKLLSDESPLPCPFTNVPSGYEADGTDHQMYSSFTSSRQEKDRLAWQKEFVEHMNSSGQIQLMQVNSILLMAAVAAMETQHTFHNRETGGPNPFGIGNNLVPPNQSDLRHLHPLHDRLCARKAKDWKRRDVWGVLGFSYAILLRSAPTAIMSPRMGGSGDPMAREFREDAKDCLEGPLQAHSFSYCRLTVVPVLQRVKESYVDSRCNLSEFTLAVLSQTYSLYMAVVMDTQPRSLSSRKKWQNTRDEEMKVQSFQLQQQQDIDNLAANFGGHTKKSAAASSPALDLMDRPDCLDDLMALAATISSLGKLYSRFYWENSSESDAVPDPCSSLRECIQKANVDSTLLPGLLSWLAALANDEKSALAVDKLLTLVTFNDKSGTSLSQSDSTDGIRPWAWLLERLYTISMSINTKASSPTSKSSVSSSSSGMPTPYYYDLDGFTQEESTTSNSNLSSRTTSSSSKAKELKGVAKFEAISILALITNVCLKSAEVRYKILSLKFPTINAQDGTAVFILFSLAITPLTPQCRGAAFNTIASLFQPRGDNMDSQQLSLLSNEGKQAWTYLEQCQALPIQLLDQYRVQANATIDRQTASGEFQFPPSSKKLASIRSSTGSVFPKDTIYQLVYELEHVESKEGVYPSTEGFLELLRSLICSVGCPPTVGEGIRTRTGCVPYLEYVISFVLPRALGIDGLPVLPFRLEGDQSRLCTKALDVICAVLIRYDLSQLPSNRNGQGQSTVSMVGIQDVADNLKTKLPKIDATSTMNDFRNSYNAQLQNASDNYATVSDGSNGARLPSTKSPGFAVMFHILSSSCGVLLKSISTVLTQNGGANGITFKYGTQSDITAFAYALFGPTPPSIQSAKMGDGPNGPYSNSRQEFLAEMPNTMKAPNVDAKTYDDAVIWREKSIEVALRILCAAVVKERDFITSLKNTRDLVKMVPVLRLNTQSSATLEVVDINVSELTQLLFTVRNSASVRSAMVSCIGYSAECASRDRWISSYALSMIYILQKTMQSKSDLAALWGFQTRNPLSLNVATRLLLAGKRMESSTDVQVVRMVLLWIVSELRIQGTIERNGLAQHLLGLPGAAGGENSMLARRGLDSGPIDCFGAILEILMTCSASQLTSSESACSSLAFEIIFRLSNLLQVNDTFSLNIVRYTATRLSNVHFWEECVVKWFADGAVLRLLQQPFSVPSQSQQVMQTLAWFLKGLCCELKILVGSADLAGNNGMGASQLFLAPQPQRCSQLLSSLLSQGAIMESLIDRLPLHKVSLNANSMTPPQHLLAAAVVPLPGPREVVEGYELIDTEKILKEISRSGTSATTIRTEEICAWVDNWNAYTKCDCAVSHLSKAVATVFEVSISTADAISLFQTEHVNSGNLPGILMGILKQMNTNSGRAIDDELSTSATRSLGEAVLIISDFLTSRTSEISPIANNFMQLASEISRCMQLSAMGNDATADSVLRNERTVCLASALSLLSKHAAVSDPSVVYGYEDECIRGVQCLAPITCFKVASGVANSGETAAMLARTCVATLVDTFTEREDALGRHPFVVSAFSLPWVESLLRLLADLDTNVCCLLQQVSQQRSGALLLISGGIGEALLSAAKTWIRDEGSKLVAPPQNGSTVDMFAPQFLSGHLKLMSALLATDNLPDQTFLGFLATCIDTLGVYRPILSSLCSNMFPRQADVLHDFLKCLALIVSVTNPISSDGRSEMMSSQKQQLRESLTSKQFMEAGIARLVSTLWEHPLPRDLQRSVQLPADLTESTSMKRYEIPSWFDTLEVMLAARDSNGEANAAVVFDAPSTHTTPSWAPSVNQNKKWSLAKFEYSIVALKILCIGSSILRRLNRLDLVDVNSLARGICRCSHGAKVVVQRLQDVKRMVGPGLHAGGSSELECQYLEVLASGLVESVEHELLLGVMLTSGGSPSKENSYLGGKELAEHTLTSAISISGLSKDPEFFSYMGNHEDASSRAELLKALSQEITEV